MAPAAPRRSPGRAASVVLVAASGAGSAMAFLRLPLLLGVVGVLAFAGLLVKVALAQRYRPLPPPATLPGCAVVMPVYNEDPVLLRASLLSVLGQSCLPAEFIVVDDGSTSPDCWRLARELLPARTGYRALRYPDNRGKRHALLRGVAETSSGIVVTLDSDTVLAPDALAALLGPLADERVHAVTADIEVLNRTKNWLTRLVHLQYRQSFLFQRAAYGALRSVLCCCGSLAAYRRAVITDHADDFAGQRFLGVAVQYGDDRRLTNYALSRGHVVFQSASRAWTMAPERPGHYLRQQMRWTRSFIRESAWALRHLSPRRWAWWLTLGEVLLWGPVYGAYAVAWIMLSASLGLQFLVAGAAFSLVIATARAWRSLNGSGGPLDGVAVGPVFGALHLVATPLLFLAACTTLRQGSWGTRQQVEVRLA